MQVEACISLFDLRRAEYGNRTRLPGLGSPCTTDVLIPHARNRLERADTRTRTGDLRITNALLYQLSHIGERLSLPLYTRRGSNPGHPD